MLCLGAYQNEKECRTCDLETVCIQGTLYNDGVIDGMAKEDEAWWREVAEASADAAECMAVMRMPRMT